MKTLYPVVELVVSSCSGTLLWHAAVEFSWNSVGVHLELSWCSVGAQLELSWNSVGAQLEFIWRSVGVQLEFIWSSVGISWNSVVVGWSHLKLTNFDNIKGNVNNIGMTGGQHSEPYQTRAALPLTKNQRPRPRP